MSFRDQPNNSSLRDLFERSYELLKYRSQKYKYLPWESPKAFVEEWVEAFYSRGSASNLRLAVYLAGSEELMADTFNVLCSFAKTSSYPSHMLARIQEIKSEIQPSSLSFSGLSLSSNSAELNQKESEDYAGLNISTRPLDPHMDPNFVQELIHDMPEVVDNDPSTSIVSHTSEAFEEVTEADANFGIQSEVGPTDFSVPQQPQELTRNPLTLLWRISRKKKSGHPKKEYFRCQQIRALKKSIRQIKMNKIPGTSIHKVDKSRSSQVTKWTELKDFYRSNSTTLLEICETAAGPTTDGKKKRNPEQSEEAKSYNNEYCTEFFSSDVVKGYNAIFCDLVYDCPPAELCVKMKASCCQSVSGHGDECRKTWDAIRKYAKVGMLQELGLPVEVPRETEELRTDEFLSLKSSP